MTNAMHYGVRYQGRRQGVQDRLAELSAPENTFIENARYGLSLLSDLQCCYAQAGIEAKDRILGSIFPEKLTFEEGEYRTPTVCTAIQLLRGKQPKLARNSELLAAILDSQSPEVPLVGLGPEQP